MSPAGHKESKPPTCRVVVNPLLIEGGSGSAREAGLHQRVLPDAHRGVLVLDYVVGEGG